MCSFFFYNILTGVFINSNGLYTGKEENKDRKGVKR